MKNLKITLTEFDEPKTFSINEIKNWFPSGKFDKRAPWECVKKWVDTNQKYFDFLGIMYSWDNDKGLTIEPSNKIGLAPIKNPYGGKVYGSITVKPKIGWIQISEILDSIEWKIKPYFLETEEPIMCDGVLPRWIKAMDTLKAIEKALQFHLRGMKEVHEIKDNPVGKVNWGYYAMQNIPSGKWNKFSCTITNYSIDLDIHRQFKGIIEEIEKDLLAYHTPIEIKRQTLPILHRIKKFLENIESEPVSVDKLKRLNVPSFYRSAYEDAKARAIEYIYQSKFSIYAGEFFGLPWAIEMDRLFEYWIEYWTYKFSKQVGANFYSDIGGNSKIRFLPLGMWRGLKHLKPDIIVEKDECTMIIDVKYKKHLLYLKLGNFPKDILEEHRKDIHQVLAYASSSSNTDKIAILIYPKLLRESIVEKAEIINYSNSNINLKLIKIDTSFDPSELLDKLHSIWRKDAAKLLVI